MTTYSTYCEMRTKRPTVLESALAYLDPNKYKAAWGVWGYFFTCGIIDVMREGFSIWSAIGPIMIGIASILTVILGYLRLRFDREVQREKNRSQAISERRYKNIED